MLWPLVPAVVGESFLKVDEVLLPVTLPVFFVEAFVPVVLFLFIVALPRVLSAVPVLWLLNDFSGELNLEILMRPRLTRMQLKSIKTFFMFVQFNRLSA